MQLQRRRFTDSVKARQLRSGESVRRYRGLMSCGAALMIDRSRQPISLGMLVTTCGMTELDGEQRCGWSVRNRARNQNRQHSGNQNPGDA